MEQFTEKAILVSLHGGNSLFELEQLAETAGVQVLASITQKKDTVDPRWYVGKGKVFEIKERLQALDGNVVIFDHELSGAQVRNLDSVLEVKIIDRTQLILDIFAQRARTREGKIQVELAQLNYLLPRLSGQGKNLSRLGGGIGTRGPGETKLETDRRHIRNRIRELKNDLKAVVKHRALHRERRKKSGVVQIALVGYTNAGKSTLLKQLTGRDTYIENKLFATLDPTSRSLKLPNGQEVMITDTVGFIQHLPHELVAAFRATLEEVCEADLILHVVDSSSEMIIEQMKVVEDVLMQLGAHQTEQIIVYNKRDLLEQQMDVPVNADSSILISAYDASDLEKLKQRIQETLTGSVEVFRIPASSGDKIACIYRIGEVLEQEMDGEDMIFKVRTNQNDYERYGYLLEEFRSGMKRGFIE